MRKNVREQSVGGFVLYLFLEWFLLVYTELYKLFVQKIHTLMEFWLFLINSGAKICMLSEH